MENISIKDLFLSTLPEQDSSVQTKKKGVRKTSEYEVITVSGPDFAVRRKGTNPKLLVILPSQKQFYVKNERTGLNEILDLSLLQKFLSGISAETHLSLADENGIYPFWIQNLERSKEFAVKFMCVISSDSFCSYASKDMISFEDFYCVRNADYTFSDLDADFKKIKVVFDTVAEQVPRQIVKEAFSRSFSPYTRGFGKTDSIFSSMFNRDKICYSRHEGTRICWAEIYKYITLFDWLENNWGVEGVRTFIRTYLENPVERLSDNFVCKMIQTTSFSLQDFVDYAFCECTKQGYADDSDDFVQLWNDCLDFQMEIYGKIIDKYPENLASFEKSLSYRISKIQKAKEIENFDIAVENMKKYEGSVGKYVVICPKTPLDMIEEGQMQSNCVGGYVKRVADGECMVFFMRPKSAPDKSLVTIEVRDGKLAQVRTRFNKKPTEEQQNAVEKWFYDQFCTLQQLDISEINNA
ncbi:MAG: PcfJ domain-containing protein [Anaerolineaceae bacterium]|nr:PcfJ domain-containing protein [Anaerolineaceae bacterium]